MYHPPLLGHTNQEINFGNFGCVPFGSLGGLAMDSILLLRSIATFLIRLNNSHACGHQVDNIHHVSTPLGPTTFPRGRLDRATVSLDKFSNAWPSSNGVGDSESGLKEARASTAGD